MVFPIRAIASAAMASVVACVLSLAPAASAAQAPHDDADRTEAPEVRGVDIRGVHAISASDLRRSLATQPSSCLSALFRPICLFSKSRYFYERRYFDRLEFRRDVIRLLVFYYKRGWRDATVDTTVTRDDKGGVRILFEVVEGPPTIVDTVAVTGLQGVLGRRTTGRRAPNTRARLQKGDPLNLLRLDTAVVRIREALLDRGRGNAVVDAPNVEIDTIAHRARVTIATRPGPLTPVARVDIVQLRPEHHVSDETIRNSLTFKRGELFRRTRVAESQRALYESGLFRSALIDTAIATDAANGRTVCAQQGVGSAQRQAPAAVAAGGAVRDSAKNVVVCVLEGQLREARASAGFTTADFFSLEGRFTHNYWLGGARRLDITGAVGNLGARQLNDTRPFFDVFSAFPKGIADTSRYLAPTFQVGANVRQRWFRSPRNTIGLGIFAHRRVSPGVFVDRGYGSNAVFTHSLTPRVPLSAAYRFEISRVDAGDIYFCVNFGVCDLQTVDALRGQQRLSPAALTGSISTADDPLEPTHGVIGRTEFEHASRVTLSDYRYNRLYAEGATYMHVPVSRRAVLAVRGQVGWVHALESTNEAVGVPGGEPVLHPSKRFYAGGSQSVRGFGENQLGPRVLTVDPAKFTSRVVTKSKTDSVVTPECPASTPSQLRTCFAARGGALKDADFTERPLGGTTLLLGSVELRVPIWGPVLGAVFVDGAMLGERSLGDVANSTAAITPGFGIRYLSPVGPVRVDLGVRPKLTESLPVFTQITDSTSVRRLVDLTDSKGCIGSNPGPGCRIFPLRESGSGIRRLLDRLTLHLSIGEAF